MKKKKPARTGKTASVKGLKPRKLTAKQARSVQGGGKASPTLMQACATGVHIREATITH